MLLCILRRMPSYGERSRWRTPATQKAVDLAHKTEKTRQVKKVEQPRLACDPDRGRYTLGVGQPVCRDRKPHGEQEQIMVWFFGFVFFLSFFRSFSSLRYDL